MLKEEFNETNEILYGKKNTQSNPSEKFSGDDLTEEILYGKRKTKIEGEPAVTTSDGDKLMDEILYGKATPSTPDELTKKKVANRDDYFGL